jgi:DNA repair exonuclease SbcCD ATPase subunit
MRIASLRVRGFKRLSDLQIDCDQDRILVVGPNEAGKSTLLECVLAGLYGLAPGKRGSGHQAALRDVTPWGGEQCGLSLSVRLDDGRVVETDWDFSGERTQVIDHTAGKDISASFASGTHGWLDVGHSLLSLPGAVFQQFTCVGEGELAVIGDDVEIRESLLRLSDSGVDVLVEQAIARLEEAARQATIPKVNAATRRNELLRKLAAAQRDLAAAEGARLALEAEIEGIGRTEAELDELRDKLAGMLAEDERRQAERRQLSTEIDRVRGRLAESQLRLYSLDADTAGQDDLAWSEAELEAARQALIAPDEGRDRGERLGLALGLAVVLCGIGAITGGLLLALPALSAVGAVAAGIGVLALTRRKGGLGGRPLELGAMTFPDRSALMVAFDHQRARRDLSSQHAHLAQLVARHNQLLRSPPPPDAGGAESAGDAPELSFEESLSAATARQQALTLRLERERTTLQVRTSQIPEVAPLEEQVAGLNAQIDELESFGMAARLAADQLDRASREIRRAYAPKLQRYLSSGLPRITAGRYAEAVVNEKFEVILRAPETNSMVEMSRLSRGTQQQVYLLLRLGLLDIVAAIGERLPLFLDDALALSDDERRGELLKVLEAEDRQVIYFTARQRAAAAAFGDSWHRVELPAPGAGSRAAPELSVVETPSA